MVNLGSRIIALLFPLLLVFRQCQARVNVTMHLGLTYDSSRNCDESPYKVTVCIGHKLDKCRIFGPHLFYVQAACAAYGPKEVIQFEVDSVEEPLRVDATIKATNSDKEFQLQPVTANLTFPRPIDAKTKNLKMFRSTLRSNLQGSTILYHTLEMSDMSVVPRRAGHLAPRLRVAAGGGNILTQTISPPRISMGKVGEEESSGENVLRAHL